MLLTFGRSAFAMPPISGVVLAAGSAACSASCGGAGKAYKNGGGSVECVAAPAAPAQRTISASGAAYGMASCVGAARADKNGTGGATAVAGLAGIARCDFNSGAGASAGVVTPAAVASRRIKVSGICLSGATADGEGQNWARVTPLAAEGFAVVWGTFHQVARGTVPAGATLSASAVRILQSAGGSEAQAVTGGEPARLFASAAGATRGNVISIGAARRVSAGVGYQDGFGDVTCAATAANPGGTAVNPTLQIIARAVLTGEGEAAFGAGGAAVARAVVVSGEANLLPTTQLGGVTVSAALVGAASTTCFIPSARGVCTVQAGIAVASVRLAASGGVVLASAADAADATIIRLGGGSLSGAAAVGANGVRVALAYGQLALGAALTDAGVQLNPLSPSSFVIEVGVPHVDIEADVPENLVTVDAIDTLVEAA